VDETREITEWAQYSSLDGKRKFLLLDECHALSKAAWQSLLKIMEEPPDHVYFALCTTDAQKVPPTIKTRGAIIALKPVPLATLADYAEAVIGQEKLVIPDGALRYITGRAEGSVRQLLVSLSLCNGAENVAAVQQVLEQTVEDDAFVALARMLVSDRRSFVRACKMLVALRESSNAEATRIQLISYITSVFFNEEGLAKDKVREDLIGLMDQLSRPVPEHGGWAALACAIYYAIQNP
jgi:DNA polymerase-3 subunit gamma/tau